MTNQKTTMDAFFLGLIGGVVAGYLFSPRTGVENRQMLMDKANEAKDKINEKKYVAKTKLNAANNKAKELKDDIKDTVANKSNSLKDRAEIV